jgi:hypothetical protein
MLIFHQLPTIPYFDQVMLVKNQPHLNTFHALIQVVVYSERKNDLIFFSFSLLKKKHFYKTIIIKGTKCTNLALVEKSNFPLSAGLEIVSSKLEF